jgi:hypothetical protein
MDRKPWYAADSGRTLPGLQPVEDAPAVGVTTRPFDRSFLSGHVAVFEALPKVIVDEPPHATSLSPFAVDAAEPLATSTVSPDATSVLPVIGQGMADRLIGARRARIQKSLAWLGAVAAGFALVAGAGLGVARFTEGHERLSVTARRDLESGAARTFALTSVAMAAAKSHREPTAPRPKRRAH